MSWVRILGVLICSVALAAAQDASTASNHRVAGGLTSPADDVNWPHFRFDAGHTGNQPFETALGRSSIRSAELLWQDDLGGELVFSSSPVVVDGIVYIGEIDGTLFAYPADGCGSQFCTQPLWQSTYLAQVIDTPAVANGIVYVGSQTDFQNADGKLNAFTAAGCGQSVCAPLWQGMAGPGGLQSSPIVTGGFVFVGGLNGKLYVFDAAGCGEALCPPLWTGRAGGSIESTPLVYKGTVFVGADDGKLYAFPARGCGNSSCNPRWTGRLPSSAFTSSPAVSNDLVYIGSSHGLSVFNANGCGTRQCDPVWQAVDNNLFFYGSPAVADGLVYIAMESQLNVYDAAGCGHPVCSPQFILFGTGAQDAIESSPTVANGVVFAGRNSSELLAWPARCSRQMCNELWIGHTDDPIVNSSPTVVNGKVYIGGSDHGFGGRLYVYGVR